MHPGYEKPHQNDGKLNTAADERQQDYQKTKALKSLAVSKRTILMVDRRLKEGKTISAGPKR